VPLTSIEQRPDIIIADYNLKIAAEKIGIAYSNLFPSINILAPFGVENSDNISGGNFFASTWWLSMVQGNMNLLDKSAYDNIDQTKSEYKAQSYTYLQTVKSAFAQVDDGLAWQKNASASLTSYNQARLNADEAYRLSMSRYKLGAISYSDTITYKLQLDTAQDKYDQAKQAHISSLINLYQVLGSGYLAKNKSTNTINSRNSNQKA
jgi:multidrug efflux system outer membrane protein